MIPWLVPGGDFPPVESALDRPNGLLAAGEDLDAAILERAYRRGIFPWYSEGEPVLWWSPHPRMVLEPPRFHASRSLRRTLRLAATDGDLEIVADRDFDAVLRECAAPRRGQDGTWITARVRDAYGELARRGMAHSIELFRGGRRVGGLYGVAIGRAFFGESMFSRESGASKIALATLVAIARLEGIPLIDCQQNTAHLASLGAEEIPRAEFCRRLARETAKAAVDWNAWRGRPLNFLLEPLGRPAGTAGTAGRGA